MRFDVVVLTNMGKLIFRDREADDSAQAIRRLRQELMDRPEEDPMRRCSTARMFTKRPRSQSERLATRYVTPPQNSTKTEASDVTPAPKTRATHDAATARQDWELDL